MGIPKITFIDVHLPAEIIEDLFNILPVLRSHMHIKTTAPVHLVTRGMNNHTLNYTE